MSSSVAVAEAEQCCRRNGAPRHEIAVLQPPIAELSKEIHELQKIGVGHDLLIAVRCDVAAADQKNFAVIEHTNLLRVFALDLRVVLIAGLWLSVCNVDRSFHGVFPIFGAIEESTVVRLATVK